jgi:hypothetical protein
MKRSHSPNFFKVLWTAFQEDPAPRNWGLIFIIYPIVRVAKFFEGLWAALKEDTAPRNWGGTFILFSIILFAIYGFIRSDGQSSMFADILGIFAGALLTSGLFSILLGLKEFTNYTSEIIANLLMDNTYLSKLTMKEKKLLASKIDENIFGEEVVKSGPYTFLHDDYPKIYHEPYRTNYVEHFTLKADCTKQDNIHTFPCKQCKADLDGHWCMEGSTKYILHFEHISAARPAGNESMYPKQDIAIPISFDRYYYNTELIKKYNDCFHEGLQAEDCCPTPILRVIICGRTIKQDENKPVTVKIVYTSPDLPGEKQTTPEQSGQSSKSEYLSLSYSDNQSENVEDIHKFMTEKCYPITIKKGEMSDRHSISIESNTKMVLKGEGFLDGKVEVCIEEATLVCKKDMPQYMQLSYPTHGITASYVFKDPNADYIFHPYLFTQEQNDIACPVASSDFNTISFGLNDWMIRGHGYSISWIDVGKTTSTVAGQKNS